MADETEEVSQSCGEATRIFMAYVAAEDAGLGPRREAILQNHPHLEPLLTQYFSVFDFARWGNLRDAPPDPNHASGSLGPSFLVIPTLDSRLAGGFELVEELGKGGSGTVYRARINGLAGDPDIALKLLHRGQSLDVSSRLRDALVLKGLEHPNLVRVYAAGESINCGPFLASEYVPGCDLAEWLRAHGPIDERKAAEILLRLSRALHAAHDKDVLHLDIKPDNIFGCGETLVPEQLKIGDFGLSRFITDSTTLPEDGRSFETGGTTGYMAPEQYCGLASPRSDIFALGALMLCMVGTPDPQRPVSMKARFLSREQSAALDRLRGTAVQRLGEPDRSRQVREEFRRQDIAGRADRIADPQLRAIIRKSLAVEPGQRYQTALALAEDLAAWLENRPLLHADYDYTLPTRFRMLLERCRSGENSEDHTKLWGMACLVIGGIAILASTSSTLLILAGFDVAASRWITSIAYISAWSAVFAWATLATRFRHPTLQLFGYTLIYFVSYLVLRLLIVRDDAEADSTQFLITGVLSGCIGLGNRLWRFFFYVGLALIALSWPVASLLRQPGLTAFGPMLVGGAQGIPFLFFSIMFLRPRAFSRRVRVP